MLINTSMTIAYKCSSCGAFEFFDTSLFKLLCKKEYRFACRCNNSNITIIRENSRGFKAIIPCIGCGNDHTFTLKRNDILGKELNSFFCPNTGMAQCFVGSDLEVRKKVDSVEKEFDELMSKFGYDDYFKNTQVMLELVNKIHDIAERGDLYCECGGSDIDLILLSDRIHLSCKRCPGEKTMYAGSNEDLKKIEAGEQALVLQSPHHYNVRHRSKSGMTKEIRPDVKNQLRGIRSILRETDGKL